MEKSIVLTGIETKYINGTQVFTLLSGKEKYTFWQKKKDGADTVAYTQFQKFQFKQGDTVAMMYDTTESGTNSFTGKPFVNNNIKKFLEVGGVPASAHVSNVSQTFNEIPVIQVETKFEQPKTDYLLMINSLSERVSTLEKFLNIPTIDEDGDDKIKLEDCPF